MNRWFECVVSMFSVHNAQGTTTQSTAAFSRKLLFEPFRYIGNGCHNHQIHIEVKAIRRNLRYLCCALHEYVVRVLVQILTAIWLVRFTREHSSPTTLLLGFFSVVHIFSGAIFGVHVYFSHRVCKSNSKLPKLCVSDKFHFRSKKKISRLTIECKQKQRKTETKKKPFEIVSGAKRNNGNYLFNFHETSKNRRLNKHCLSNNANLSRQQQQIECHRHKSVGFRYEKPFCLQSIVFGAHNF